MNGAVRLYVHGATAEEWTRRFGIVPFSHPCYVCGRVLTTTLPFVQGALRGLQAPPCACGDVQTPFAICRDPKYGDLFTGSEVSPKSGRSSKNKPR